MASVSVSLPVSASDGVGAFVDCSGLSPERTVTFDGGAFSGNLFLEGTNDAGASVFPIAVGPFTGQGGNPAPQPLLATVQRMRVRRTASTGGALGTPTVTVAASVASSNVFGALPVPSSDGVGAGVDVSGGGDINTIGIQGPFSGQLTIEVSTDGGATFVGSALVGVPSQTTPGSPAAFNLTPGAISKVRVRRFGSISGQPSPAASVGSGSTAGGAGAFPGFGAAPPPVEDASSAGAAGTASRSDHTHEGAQVASFDGSIIVTKTATNPLSWDLSVTASGETPPLPVGASSQGSATGFARADHQHPFPSVNGISTGLSQLVSFPSATYAEAALIWVESVAAWFQLTSPSALAVDGITVVNAFGQAGAQWVRLDALNRTWQARNTWWVDPQNVAASDENTGATSLAPLKTYAELARRLFAAQIAQTTTVNCVSDAVAGDTAYFTCRSNTNRITFAGTALSGAPLYSGTVTAFTPQALALAADDNELNDATIPVSFTASGLLATNLLFKRTNGAACYWFGAKDLGAKTLRTSVPVNANNNAITNPAPADTYSVYKLPQLPSINFNREAFSRGVNFTEVAIAPSAAAQYQQWGTYNRCFFNAGGNVPSFNGYVGLQNTAFDYGASNGQLNSFQPGADLGIMAQSWGMHRTTGTNGQVQQASGTMNWQGITLQGCGLVATSGATAIIQGRISVYDTNGTWPCCWADYWTSVLFITNVVFGTAGIAGTGNTGKLLTVQNWSNMAYVGSVPTVAGASTDAAPINVGGAASAVGALPINKTLANDIGIFATS